MPKVTDEALAIGSEHRTARAQSIVLAFGTGEGVRAELCIERQSDSKLVDNASFQIQVVA